MQRYAIVYAANKGIDIVNYFDGIDTSLDYLESAISFYCRKKNEKSINNITFG
jgi:hypothetical protein